MIKAGEAGATLASLASTFGVSVPTISRIIGPRRGQKNRGRSVQVQRGAARSSTRGLASGDVSVEFSGNIITITLPRDKKALVKSLLRDLI